MALTTSSRGVSSAYFTLLVYIICLIGHCFALASPLVLVDPLLFSHRYAKTKTNGTFCQCDWMRFTTFRKAQIAPKGYLAAGSCKRFQWQYSESRIHLSREKEH